MSEARHLIERAKEIRYRLRYPPNAVKDIGIDLKRHKRIPPAEESILIEKIDETPPTPLEEKTPAVLEYAPPNPQQVQLLVGKVLLKTILKVVAKHYSVTVADIKGHNRHQGYVRPRHICYYLAHKYGKLSWPQIGRLMNRADHTTPMYGAKNIEEIMLVDEELVSNINKIECDLVEECLGGRGIYEFHDEHNLTRPAVAPNPEHHLEAQGQENLPESQVHRMD